MVVSTAETHCSTGCTIEVIIYICKRQTKVEGVPCRGVIRSEYSEEDGSFLIRPLPWRSEKVTKFCSLKKVQEEQEGRSRVSAIKASF